MDIAYLMLSLVVLMNFQLSSTINCFTCTSMEKNYCGDDFRITTSDADSRAWCDGSCVKRRGERVSGSVRRIEVVRSCVLRRSEGCYNENFNSLSMYTCSCNSEFCNSSSQISYSMSIIALSLSVVALSHINVNI